MEQLTAQDVNSVSAGSTTQLTGKIQLLSIKVKTLEKDLYYYKKTSRDLKKKLQTLKGKTPREETVSQVSSIGRDYKSGMAKGSTDFHLSAPLELSAKTSSDRLGKGEGAEAAVPVSRPVLIDDSEKIGTCM